MFVVRKCWHVCPVYSNTSDRWYTEKRAGHDKITKTSMAGVTVLKWGGGDWSKWGNFSFVQLKTKLIFYSLNCRNFCCAIWFRVFALEGDQFSHNNMGAMRITSDHLHRLSSAKNCGQWKPLTGCTFASVPDKTMDLQGAACWFAQHVTEVVLTGLNFEKSK